MSLAFKIVALILFILAFVPWPADERYNRFIGGLVPLGLTFWVASEIWQ